MLGNEHKSSVRVESSLNHTAISGGSKIHLKNLAYSQAEEGKKDTQNTN